MLVRVLRYQIWLLALVLTLVLEACSQSMSDEARLRQAVARMGKAAESRKIGPILSYLDDHFVGNQGYHKGNIRGLLRLYFEQNQHIQVFVHITRIQIRGGTAQLGCEVLLTGRDKQQVLPRRVRALVVDSLWHRRHGVWRVVRASWKNSLPQP